MICSGGKRVDYNRRISAVLPRVYCNSSHRCTRDFYFGVPCIDRLRPLTRRRAQRVRPDGGASRGKDTTAAGANESDHRSKGTNRTGQQRARGRT